MCRWHLDETVRQVGSMLITDSRGLFDALTRSESPQLRLRSSRTGEKEQCAVSDARIHWVNTSTMLADSLTKTGYPARAVMESFLVKKRWRLPSSLADAGKQEVHLCSVKKIWTRSIHQQIKWRSTLCCRMFGHRRVSSEWSKIEEKFWGMVIMARVGSDGSQHAHGSFPEHGGECSLNDATTRF